MYRIKIAISLLGMCVTATCCSAIDNPKPNVLLISVDDLRPELGCYGAKHIVSPNIDKFAAGARVFQRAYCQQAVCNPSRTSFMTGMRPDSIGVTGNHSHFRTNHPNVVTLPQHFKKNGYHAAAVGKIYHGVFPEGSSKTKWDTMGDPLSWSEPAIRFGPRYYYTEEGIAAAKKAFERVYKPKNPKADDWTKKLVFGPATESPVVPDNQLYDGKVADAAIKKLNAFEKNKSPFFLAVGFIKPHSPYIAPKKYFDLYKDVIDIRQSAFPKNAPRLAGHNSGELRRYTDQPDRGEIPEANARRVRQAYFACVSYIDAQIGRVLNELDRLGLDDNTIVVLLGDHGYHLGEQGLWGKTTNFELDTRVPLIIRVPGMKQAGIASSSLVELVDLYPTLVELAGLPKTKQQEGESLAPVLNNPTAEINGEAVSQYPRGGGVMGYSIRNNSYRLTQWIQRASGEILATELYEYSPTLIESKNIATEKPALARALTEQLSAKIRIQIREPSRPRTIDGTRPDRTGFEKAKPGPFKELETAIGVWTVNEGSGLVDDKHSKSGKQCLQLAGGKKTSVTLALDENIDSKGELRFWAERWTRREPFSFRIEKQTGDDWKEIYNGDKKVKVGRAFLSDVRVPLGEQEVKKIRLTVTSPPNTGILIDDFRVVPTRPQRIVKVEAVPYTVPALKGIPNSPILKLRVVTEGSLNPISLNKLRAAWNFEKEDVESVRVYFGGASERFAVKNVFGPELQSKVLGPSIATSIAGKQPLNEGENYFWLTSRVSKEANIDRSISASCSLVEFSNGEKFRLDAKTTQRIGVAVRNGGDDGIHTFRIPGLATTNKGTLIGVYDVRRRGGGDLPGDIDVGMSRSVDGGQTWQPMKIIMDMGKDPKWRYDGIGDPAVLVDRNTGTIWVASTWSHGNRSWFGSGPGLEPTETGQLMLVRSDDDGLSWSKPINITKQIKKPEWSFILQGPGKGITMNDGTIVFAAQYQDPPNSSDRTAHRLPHSTIIYSKDHGKTWRVGTGAFDDTTESQVVEVKPGVLMLNCRYNRKPVRVVMTTRDLGKTWQKHTTSERSLIEPRACMASIIDTASLASKRWTPNSSETPKPSWLLFSNPDSTSARRRIMIKASPDRGLTWPKQNRLLLDEEQGRGYSCLSMIDEKTVGILYEGSQAHMTFQRIPLSELVGNSQSQPPEHKIPKPVSLSLPKVFGDHMVLQAGMAIPVWGRASPGSIVSVTFGKEKVVAKTNEVGQWSLKLRERKANATPIRMTVRSELESIQLDDILIGEVWLCAGQSNMEWMLRQSQNGQAEIKNAVRPQLRLMHLVPGARGSSGVYHEQHLARLIPSQFCQGSWQVAGPESAASFSAVAWYFGRRLRMELKVPVGLICPAVGGTPTEAWISREAISADPSLKGLVVGNWLDNQRLGDFCRTRGTQNLLACIQNGEAIPCDDLGPNHSFKPGFMWEAGIKPLIPFGIRGAIWYQGESNAETSSRSREHGQLFRLLVKHWREEWGQGDFPFLFVQLPGIKRPAWPWFRDGQLRALKDLDNVGMAVTIDIGHPTNVHPPLKQPVGDRLALWALGDTYQSRQSSIYSSPMMDVAEREGDSMNVSFKHVGHGLKSNDGKPLRHFEVCGRDRIFYAAEASISGRNSVSVSSPQVVSPRHVRYAWKPFPDPPTNLVNSLGLPASPFSSESEEEIYERRTNVQRDRD